MIVTLAPSVSELTINDGKGSVLTIHRGTKIEVDAVRVIPFLERGTLVKAEYPELLNNQAAAIPWGG